MFTLFRANITNIHPQNIFYHVKLKLCLLNTFFLPLSSWQPPSHFLYESDYFVPLIQEEAYGVCPFLDDLHHLT